MRKKKRQSERKAPKRKGVAFASLLKQSLSLTLSLHFLTLARLGNKKQKGKTLPPDFVSCDLGSKQCSEQGCLLVEESSLSTQLKGQNLCLLPS